MRNRRALVPLEDVRRWAKVSREQGVAISGRVAADGSVTLNINPITDRGPVADDLDERIARYAGR